MAITLTLWDVVTVHCPECGDLARANAPGAPLRGRFRARPPEARKLLFNMSATPSDQIGAGDGARTSGNLRVAARPAARG